MLVQCWPIVSDAGLSLYQHLLNVSCLLGRQKGQSEHGENGTIVSASAGTLQCVHKTVYLKCYILCDQVEYKQISLLTRIRHFSLDTFQPFLDKYFPHSML